MNIFFKNAAYFVAAAVILVSCGKSNTMEKLVKEGYQRVTETTDAMLYKVTKEVTDGLTINPGELVKGTVVVRFNDSILQPKQDTTILGQAGGNQAPWEPLFTKLHVGEEMTLALNLDSMYKGAPADQLPSFYTPGAGDVMFYEFAVTGVTTYETYTEEFRVKDSVNLQKYLADNNVTVNPSATGLYRIITEQGKGAKVANNKKVDVHYTGKLLDGSKFDSSYDRNEPISITEGKHEVIPGWEEGLMGLPEGTKATLIIPCDLAYGPTGSGSIPPYSTLVFDVEVVKVYDAK